MIRWLVYLMNKIPFGLVTRSDTDFQGKKLNFDKQTVLMR